MDEVPVHKSSAPPASLDEFDLNLHCLIAVFLLAFTVTAPPKFE
jgi:hypothetical protein